MAYCSETKLLRGSKSQEVKEERMGVREIICMGREILRGKKWNLCRNFGWEKIVKTFIVEKEKQLLWGLTL